MSGDKDMSAPLATPRAKATASLNQLRIMWGTLEESNPDRVVRMTLFKGREVWKRISGSGIHALYELQGEG